MLYIVIPKGFFPVQETGLIPGHLRSLASPYILRARWPTGRRALAAVVHGRRILNVESLSSFIGVDGTQYDAERRAVSSST